MEKLVLCVEALEQGYKTKLKMLIDFYQQHEYDRRTYEWTIRKYSGDYSDFTSMEVPSFRNFISAVSTISSAIDAKVLDFNQAVSKEHDALTKRYEQLSQRMKLVEQESVSKQKNMQESLKEKELELYETQKLLSAAVEQVSHIKISHAKSLEQHETDVQEQMSLINDMKHRLYAQSQEVEKLKSLIEGYKRRLLMYHDDDSAETTLVETERLPPQPEIVDVTRRNSNAEVEDLRFKLDRQIDLNAKLRKLLQANSHIKLIEDFNQIYNRNMDLERSSKNLLSLLVKHNIDVDSSYRVDDVVQDLVDQRDAWKQNTRLLENQVYTMRQEIDTLKSQVSLATLQPNSSVPVVGQLLSVTANFDNRSAPQLKTEKHVKLRPESKLFHVYECPYCAPSAIIDL